MGSLSQAEKTDETFQVMTNTPLKTNMEPEIDSSQNRNLLFQGFMFRFHVSF